MIINHLHHPETEITPLFIPISSIFTPDRVSLCLYNSQLMMDADTDIHTGMVGSFDQNGAQYDHHDLGEEDIAVEVNGISESSMVGVGHDANQEIGIELNGMRMVDPITLKVEDLDIHVENSGSAASAEVETTETNAVKKSKPQNRLGSGKNEKPSNAKKAIGTTVKKNNSNKEVKPTSNGTLSAKTQPKQPMVKAKSFNERQATNNNPGKATKPVSSNTSKAKQPLKSELMSGSEISVQCEGAGEKPKLKSLRKEPPTKIEGNGESAESPSAADARARREGKLPSYGFSFRCHERAEKRREFYTKLEEKIHALEVEKNNMQAKSKESQEAEIKMLRKSLNFKATPMPNFYQEPAPPKVELKKIPTTRPRSPKLGRKKNTSSVEAEDGDNQSLRSGRLSLDEKAIIQTNPSKGPSPVQSKRPQRKSLPRLPSEKIRLSKNAQVQDHTVDGSPPIAHVNEDVPPFNPNSAPIARVEEEVSLSNPGSAPIAHAEEEDPTSDLGEAHFGIVNGTVVQDQIQLPIEQEVVLEH